MQHSTIPYAADLRPALRPDATMVYNSPKVMGQLAAAECGIAVAVITRCSLLPGLKVLDARNGLPELPALDVVLLRSKQSERSRAVDAMPEQAIRSLKENG